MAFAAGYHWPGPEDHRSALSLPVDPKLEADRQVRPNY